jgi:anti-sigma factor RsiW
VSEGRDVGLDANGQLDDHVDVIALVLGPVDAQRRAQLADHLLACRDCRTEYDDMIATVSELLPAVPEIQPPLGFDQRVLARLRIQPPVARSSRRLRFIGLAASLIALVGAIGWFSTRDAPTQTADGVRSLQVVDGGGPVGTVSIGEVDGETVMVVALFEAPDGVSYHCLTTFADGTTAVSDSWPAGNGAWVVPLPTTSDSQIHTVALVASGTDEVWSAATFGDPDS